MVDSIVRVAPLDICPVYTGKGIQNGFTIDNWYKQCIKNQIAANSNMSSGDKWNWFKHTNYWSRSTLLMYWWKIKNNKMQPHKPPTKCPQYQNHLQCLRYKII